MASGYGECFAYVFWCVNNNCLHSIIIIIIAFDFTLVEQLVLMFIHSFIHQLHACILYLLWILLKLHGVHNSYPTIYKINTAVVFQLHFIECWIISLHTQTEVCNFVQSNVNFHQHFKDTCKLNYRQCLSSLPTKLHASSYIYKFTAYLCFSENGSFSRFWTDTGRHPSANHLRF